MKLIVTKWGEGNAFGFPAEYPRDSQLVEDKAPVPQGWEVVTAPEYDLLVSRNRAEVASINSAREAAKADEIKQSTASLSAAFDQLQSIADKFEGAGRLEPEDQLALSIHIMKAVLALRDPLLEIQKRSQ